MKRLVRLTAVLLVAGCTSARPPAVPPPTAPVVLPSPVTVPRVSYPPEPPYFDADLVIPSWPAKSTECTSGRVRLSGGQYLPSKAGKWPINAITTVPVDFDGDGTEDLAVYVTCGEGPESGGRMVVGYRQAHGGLQLIGRIVGVQDGFAMMEHMRRKGNAIEVLVSREYSDSGQQSVPSQWRTYALRGSGFRQVGGPVAFPADPPAVHLAVEPRQVVLRVAGAVRTGSLTFTVTNSGGAPAPSVLARLQLPESFQPAGPNWTDCRVESPGAFLCHLGSLAAGASRDVSYDLLAPLEPPTSHDFGITVEADAPETYVAATPTGSATLDLLYVAPS